MRTSPETGVSVEIKDIAARIREKILDLNDELVLAAYYGLEVELMTDKIHDEPRSCQLRVWLSQEVL